MYGNFHSLSVSLALVLIRYTAFPERCHLQDGVLFFLPRHTKHNEFPLRRTTCVPKSLTPGSQQQRRLKLACGVPGRIMHPDMTSWVPRRSRGPSPPPPGARAIAPVRQVEVALVTPEHHEGPELLYGVDFLRPLARLACRLSLVGLTRLSLLRTAGPHLYRGVDAHGLFCFFGQFQKKEGWCLVSAARFARPTLKMSSFRRKKPRTRCNARTREQRRVGEF